MVNDQEDGQGRDGENILNNFAYIFYYAEQSIFLN